ncbi:hypothetical protein ACJ72_03089 [Emergomyces africanus]|uniref:C6 finger domain transcription factor nscR n=1 Tax=Emergomyces africanus TaxID=1955775 RepID=A0A1B7P0L0_9EURO|nr:hypothetical protein ACJ72_03089 [Emergomyces africanus]
MNHSSSVSPTPQYSRSTTFETRPSSTQWPSTQAELESNNTTTTSPTATNSYFRDADGDGGDGGAGGEAGGTQAAGGGSAANRGGSAAATSAPRIRRRNRMITSCLECRRRKLKCDRLHPCSNCSKTKRDCLFLAPALDPNSRKKLTELKEKMGSLERSLEQDAADRKDLAQEGLLENPADGNAPVPEDEKDLKPTALAVQDAAYEDGSDDDTFDLGFKLGKLRMTDRVDHHAIGDLSVSDKTPDEAKPKGQQPLLPELISEYNESLFTPGPSYIAPHSDFFFGGGERKYSLADFLPSRAAADRLLQQYWEAVDPIAKNCPSTYF